MTAYKLEAGTAQHIGNRPHQNDRTALFTGARAPGYVLAVLSDGIAGGASASEQVLHTAKQVFDQFKPGDHPSLERLSELVREIVRETNMIIRMNAFTTKTDSLGTIVCLVLTPHGQAVWCHVGDSRLYHIQDGVCKLRSNDTAYVDYLVNHEKLPIEAARNHRGSRLLLNVLGNEAKEPFVTVGTYEGVRAGDTFLLCSDGLWHFFTDAELAAVTHKNSPRQASELLISKAQERAQGKGGNCTMAIVKLIKPPKEARNYVVQKMGRAI